MMKKGVEWTKEQEEVIDKIVEESENIGYVQGRDDLLKELIEDLRRKIIGR